MSSFSRRETGVLGTIELYSGRAATEQLRSRCGFCRCDGRDEEGVDVIGGSSFIVDGTHGGRKMHTQKTRGNQNGERRRTASDMSCGGELARLACCPRS